MHLRFNNVNDAFRSLVRMIHGKETPMLATPSRYGDVLRFPEPVTITYNNPRQRVLFNEARDCNPFFHLVESIWMLAGREDVATLDYYNSKMKEFSDNGETFHGAYGYRWREQFGYDQLAVIISELINCPTSRRCVLQIWDATCDNPTHERSGKQHDLWTACNGGKDVPCNTQAYFSIVGERLEMTVCNRSNDMVWGMLGANVVHFSYLQEYIANCVGVQVGKYHQFTNNLHVYTERWTPEKWLRDTKSPSFAPCALPLVREWATFDEEIHELLDNPDHVCWEPYLAKVVSPMMLAFRHHKERNYAKAQEAVNYVADEQWRYAARIWLYKREENWRKKNATCAD